MVHGNWTHNTLAQVALIGNINAQQIVNRWAFEASAAEELVIAGNDALAQAWATAIAVDWIAQCSTLYAACVGNGMAFSEVRAQVIERPGLFEHRLAPTSTTAGLPATGSIVGAYAGLTQSGICRWKSRLATRHARGRTYLPLVAGAVTNGVLSAGAVTALQAFADKMIVRYGGTAGTYGLATFTVYSRPYDDNYYVKRVGGVPTVIHQTNYVGDSNFVLTNQVDGFSRSQRRREMGVGR